MTLWISTWSMNARTDCTSPVTRFMMDPDAVASKKRKLSRWSLSNTAARRCGTTSSCTSRATETL